MNEQPQEVTQVHTRLLKCALEVDDSRAYWAHADGYQPVTAREAFDEYWFGARSLAWIEILLTNMRARFDAFPPALAVLHRWSQMAPDTRKLICHWHLQLADPMYRHFTGEYLVNRRAVRGELHATLSWPGLAIRAGRWTLATRIQFASKLLSAAYAAGLVETNRDPRSLALPRVPSDALEYLLYLLRGIEFAGALLDNPYLASVGLDGAFLEERLRTLPGVHFSRQATLVDFGWKYPDLQSWSAANFTPDREFENGGVS